MFPCVNQKVRIVTAQNNRNRLSAALSYDDDSGWEGLAKAQVRGLQTEGEIDIIEKNNRFVMTARTVCPADG